MKLPMNANQIAEALKVEDFLRGLVAQSGGFPEIVVIGGYAVRAYGAMRFSHDGDIMVNMNAFSALRDQYNVTKTPRLGKAQFTTAFLVEIDVYVEQQHKLRIPFDEVQAYAVKKSEIWVACIEHLIVLKLDALKNRRNTDKGVKDIEDILLLLSRNKIEHPDLLRKHLFPEDWELLEDIVGTAGNWQAFTEIDYRAAGLLQKQTEAVLRAIKSPKMEIQ